MLPWKHTRGKEAFKRVMCYVGVPEGLSHEKMIAIDKHSVSKLPTLKYTTVGYYCKALGGKL